MLETVSLRIKGMYCTMCPMKIEMCLSELDGIARISVSYASERAFLVYDREKISLNDITNKIMSLGYFVERIKYR